MKRMSKITSDNSNVCEQMIEQLALEVGRLRKENDTFISRRELREEVTKFITHNKVEISDDWSQHLDVRADLKGLLHSTEVNRQDSGDCDE